MKNTFYAVCVFALSSGTAYAQPTFTAREYIDINNIKATTLVHGDLWWDPVSQMPDCEFPKGTQKHIMSTASIWMSGMDNGILHQSAQTYRQSGNDYWPGPLDNSGSLDYPTSILWSKIWKINRTDIISFKANTTHTIGNTPAVILEWPARNNPHAKGVGGAALTITEDMAPFVDANSDGSYNALDGDYPDMKGDQMLWWVFSDNGPSHTNSTNGGVPLKVEVHAMAYALKKNTLIDDVVYYQFDIKNKSEVNYTGYRFGIWTDADLGHFRDDYIGFDSAHRMGIIYNGLAVDGAGEPTSYGSSVPMAGVTLLKMPGDNAPVYQPAGSFMYYNNDLSVMGNPENDTQYNNYLRAKWRNGAHLKNTYQGPGIISTGYATTGTDANYVFPGNPADKTQWSECASGNPPGDRRFIITTNDYNFNAGTSTQVVFALLATQPASTGCPYTDFKTLTDLADTAWKEYGNPPFLSVNNHKQPTNSRMLAYPNPVHDKLYIDAGNVADLQVQVYDALGRNMYVSTIRENGKTALQVATLPNGLYHVVATNGVDRYNQTFVKE